MYTCIPEIINYYSLYITQVPLSTEYTPSISNIEQCHDSILTMSLGLCFPVCHDGLIDVWINVEIDVVDCHVLI